MIKYRYYITDIDVFIISSIYCAMLTLLKNAISCGFSIDRVWEAHIKKWI
jgi:hypothetical protein